MRLLFYIFEFRELKSSITLYTNELVISRVFAEVLHIPMIYLTRTLTIFKLSQFYFWQMILNFKKFAKL